MWNYKAVCSRIIDGDTIEVNIDLGFYCSIRTSLRLANINAPEPRGKNKEKGIAAKEHLKKLCPEGTMLEIKTRRGKYHNRWIAEIKTPLVDNLSQQMVSDGYAIEI